MFTRKAITQSLSFLDTIEEPEAVYEDPLPYYSDALQPSIQVLNSMCTAMIESIYDSGAFPFSHSSSTQDRLLSLSLASRDGDTCARFSCERVGTMQTWVRVSHRIIASHSKALTCQQMYSFYLFVCWCNRDIEQNNQSCHFWDACRCPSLSASLVVTGYSAMPRCFWPVQDLSSTTCHAEADTSPCNCADSVM
jgi:hypothetical protein